MFLPPVVVSVLREVADALIEQPRHHWLLGQFHHAVRHDDGGGVAPHPACGCGRGRVTASPSRVERRRVGLHHLDVDVFGKRHDFLEQRPVLIEATRANATAHRQLWNLGQEKRADLDDGIAARTECRHIERSDDCRVVRVGHCARNGRRRIGDDAVVDQAQQHAVADELPAHDAIARGLAAKSLLPCSV